MIRVGRNLTRKATYHEYYNLKNDLVGTANWCNSCKIWHVRNANGNVLENTSTLVETDAFMSRWQNDD